MKVLILAILLIGCFAEEMAITQEFTDYLKKHVTWEVAEYEENVFRGWTDEEIKAMLNQREDAEDGIPSKPVEIVADSDLPSSVDWRLLNANCMHEIRNQGNCGSCWAFSATGVVSDRCCLYDADHGWLAPEELVSCDMANGGCNGGWEYTALDYVAKNGLVHEACFPYVAARVACPSKCADGKDWKASHVCKCKARVSCQGAEAMKKCITTGPVTAGMYVYRDFLAYKSGIYHWDKKSSYLGGHAIRCFGYADTPEAHWICANSWGTSWGEAGFFKIGKGEVGIDTRNPHYCDPAK